jgi:hypothetical protein
MYLTKINAKTGLVDISDENDGVLAIKAFRDLIDSKDLGLEAFTAVALYVDYESKVRFYSEKDRPRKAMEEVTGNRDAFVWNQELIQAALKKYDDLQYDPVREEGRLYYESKVKRLKEYKESEEYHSKPRNKDDESPVLRNPSQIRSDLRKINEDIKDYEKQIQGKDLDSSPAAKNGYKLTRLEQKLEKKNSFYNEVR